MSKRKAQRDNNIHLLSGQQREELGKFQKDLNKAMPHMMEMATTAKRLNQAMIDTPLWRVVDNAPVQPQPEDFEEPKMWTVGHAKVNYVDHIKTSADDEGTQDK